MNTNTNNNTNNTDQQQQQQRQKYFTGQDVWVKAGVDLNTEHAAKVVDLHAEHKEGGVDDGEHDNKGAECITIRWDTSGTRQIVSVDRVRSMYPDDENNINNANGSEKNAADTATAAPRKSRRVSNKPDRFDGKFEKDRYDNMCLGKLKDICEERDLPKGGDKADIVLRILKDDEKIVLNKKKKKRPTDNNNNNNCSKKDKKAKEKVAPKKKKKSQQAAAAKPTKAKPAAAAKKSTKAVIAKKLRPSSKGGSAHAHANKPRSRLSEIRRKKNDIENRVRTQIQTAKKKARENRNNNVSFAADGVGRRLSYFERQTTPESCSPDRFESPMFAPKSPNAAITLNSSFDDSVLTEGGNDTVSYPEPTAADHKVETKQEVLVKQEQDPVQGIYARLEVAKKDYFNNIKTIQEMKADGFPEEVIAEYVRWRDEAKANVDKLRSVFNGALHEVVL